MKRFLVFPAFAALSGTLFFLVSYVEGSSVIFQQLSSDYIYHVAPFIINIILPYSLSLGLFVGLLLALWDLLRNRHDQSSVARLPGNFFWIVVYTVPFVIANGVVYIFLSHLMPLFNIDSWMAMLTFWNFLLLNLTAITWAAIRSITTGDVLTPRVLRDKLRERSRL